MPSSSLSTSSGSPVPARLQLRLRRERNARQERHTGHVRPQQQRHDGCEWAVGVVDVARSGDVRRQEAGPDEPGEHGHHGADCQPRQARLVASRGVPEQHRLRFGGTTLPELTPPRQPPPGFPTNGTRPNLRGECDSR
jgi:hypothetical protein